MNHQWTDFLHTLKLELTDDQRSVSSVPASNQLTRFYPLLHQSIISVSGPDATKFLQGQLSCDLRLVDSAGTRLGAHCTIKGQMVSLYRVMQAGPQRYWLRTADELADTALSTLKRYIIFSKAEAVHQPDQWVGLGIAGPAAAELVRKLTDQPLPGTDQAIYLDNTVLVGLPGERFEIWTDPTRACNWLSQIADQAAPGTTNDWLLSEIQAGLPDLRLATSERFIPQMTNLQVFDGVSFSKGCYTGQEIVTRLQHRGQLKRCLYRARVTSAQLPEPGLAINAQEKDHQGEVLLSAATGQPGEYELLAILVKERAEQAPMHLDSADKAELILLELPYQLDKRLFESKR